MPPRNTTSRPAPRTPRAPQAPSKPGKEARIIALINMAARLSNRAARLRLGAFGAWPGQIPLLVCLHHDDGLIQKELVQRTKMEQPTVAEYLDRLEKDGVITRRRSKQDGRKYQVFLSSKGRAMMPSLIEGLDSGAKAFTKGLRQKDLSFFDDTISTIIEQLEAFIRSSERPDG